MKMPKASTYKSCGYPTYPKAHVSGTYRQDYRYSFNTTTGNLHWRQNFLGNCLWESFMYDNLNRLDSINGPQNLKMGYNANGNIETKTDLGRDALKYSGDYGPYALSGVETSSGLVSDSLQTISYTSFEQPNTITENPYQAVFTYNSEGQRNKMVVTQNGATIKTRWYVGSRYMEENASGVTKKYTYIGGDAYTAPVAAITQSGTTTYYYLLRDYLGNITHVYNASAGTAQEYSFDAWGRRRDKDNWGYTLSGEPELFASRGFTAHEFLPWFNLYNMNGRMYDPVVGRFLSVDNNVQDPGFSQSYNRYSYCLNNPLVYFDPTGEKFKWKWKYLVPILCFEDIMQAINDNTKGLRQKMVDAGIPDFGVGVSVNGAGNVNVNGSYKGQEVFNTENIDRSNADQKVNQAISDVRQEASMANWFSDHLYADIEFRIDKGLQAGVDAEAFGAKLGGGYENNTEPLAQFNLGFENNFYAEGYSFDQPKYGYGGITDPIRNGWSGAFVVGGAQTYDSRNGVLNFGDLQSETIHWGVLNISKSYGPGGRVNENRYYWGIGGGIAFIYGSKFHLHLGYRHINKK